MIDFKQYANTDPFHEITLDFSYNGDWEQFTANDTFSYFTKEFDSHNRQIIEFRYYPWARDPYKMRIVIGSRDKKLLKLFVDETIQIIETNNMGKLIDVRYI